MGLSLHSKMHQCLTLFPVLFLQSLCVPLNSENFSIQDKGKISYIKYLTFSTGALHVHMKCTSPGNLNELPYLFTYCCASASGPACAPYLKEGRPLQSCAHTHNASTIACPATCSYKSLMLYGNKALSLCHWAS